MAKIIVTSSQPGKRRAGTVFTGASTFELGHFSTDQLKAIAADPVLTLVYGEVIPAAGVEVFAADNPAPAPAGVEVFAADNPAPAPKVPGKGK
jgi:hypothetical protein